MSCRVYLEDQIIRIDFHAVVSAADFKEFIPVVESLELAQPVVPHRITDLTNASGMDIGFTDILALAALRKSRHFANAFKSAIVAPQPVHVGIARMFQTLNDHPQITIQIFPNLDTAKAWIAAD